MTVQGVDGPYYRCYSKSGCFHSLKVGYFPAGSLRSIKGRWRCYSCFADGFGRDVLHEWDTAMTLADYLEAPV